MAGDNTIIFKDTELRIDPEPFCTSCHIYSMNKNTRFKNPLNPKSPFKWVFMDIILATESNVLTSKTILSNYILIVYA